jgi:hypothetical protein
MSKVFPNKIMCLRQEKRTVADAETALFRGIITGGSGSRTLSVILVLMHRKGLKLPNIYMQYEHFIHLLCTPNLRLFLHWSVGVLRWN